MKRTLVDRDRLMNSDKNAVAKATVKAFDAIQHLRRETQLLGLACAFVLLARTLNFPAQDAFVAAKNLMVDPKHSSGMDHRFDAMAWHIQEDLSDEASDEGLL